MLVKHISKFLFKNLPQSKNLIAILIVSLSVCLSSHDPLYNLQTAQRPPVRVTSFRPSRHSSRISIEPSPGMSKLSPLGPSSWTSRNRECGKFQTRRRVQTATRTLSLPICARGRQTSAPSAQEELWPPSCLATRAACLCRCPETRSWTLSTSNSLLDLRPAVSPWSGWSLFWYFDKYFV